VTEPIEFPDLHESMLDESKLDALFNDIAMEAQVLSVLLKGGAEVLAEGGDVALSDALARLKGGRVRAVQVRYVHRGQAWTDTLMRTASGYRVVRIAA
jgi:hypothetical protein